MFEYGIEKSTAHLWAHICPLDATIYLYPRLNMLNVLKKYPVSTGKTFIGHLVTIRNNLKANDGFITGIEFGYRELKKHKWENASEHEAGEIGENIFVSLVDSGIIRLPAKSSKFREKKDQYMGKDFVLTAKIPETIIEVKFDRPGGVWGTGNLFVQTHECHNKNVAS